MNFVRSQVDAAGQQIALPETAIPPTGRPWEGLCHLNAGFNASLTVSMFQNGVRR